MYLILIVVALTITVSGYEDCIVLCCSFILFVFNMNTFLGLDNLNYIKYMYSKWYIKSVNTVAKSAIVSPITTIISSCTLMNRVT